MYKTSILVLFLFISVSMLTFAQEQESILSAPENWPSELLTFPLGFAPSIDVVGFEDLRFAPDWSKPDSNEFWTYTFVWYIEKESNFTENRLSKTLENYFDGLMGIDLKQKSDSVPLEKTVSVFIKTNEGFKGKIRTYDAFFTKKELILNVKVQETFCAETNKQLIVFKFSPKDFDDLSWDILNEVKLKVKCE